MANPTEAEVMRGIIHELTNLRDRFRSLAHMRNDVTWLKLAGLMDQTKDNAERLFTKSLAQRGRIVN